MPVPDTKQLFAQFLAGLGQEEPEAKGGTTRNVFDLGNAVAKVAKNAKGIEQNEAELDETPHTPQPFLKGKDFVITEKGQRDDKLINAWLKPLKQFHTSDFNNKNPKLVKQMKIMGLGNFLKYPLLWGDFIAARNWGLDKKGQPTLLDKGTLNNHIYDRDEAPKEKQKEYDNIKQSRRIVKKSYSYKGS